ncbi:transaldolase family protein [Candidatus Nitrospira neomarina]|uniref:Transaldolase family protein n=1 Tax=Candidatus Nitrospira neomarina TaxID=3020899 RepID=A0AA96GN86_9BACT|nr:transaldolase family protein [Candidatus Nitrospira neomarina]WNM60611.1 transaldolase family protein [Candidatus Nitrospira neomarina]
MKFYLDTVSLTEIQEIGRLGVLDGIAMNATLITEQGLNFYQGIRGICRYVDSPISVGVLSIEEEAIVKEGKELSKIHKNVMVKCPLTPAGLKATKRLTAEGIRVNVSLCFSLTQALIAAKAGAWCVSICLDRTGDKQTKGDDTIRNIVTVFRSYGLSTQVLLAGIRSPHDVLEAALAGGHICTMRFPMFLQLFDPAV